MSPRTRVPRRAALATLTGLTAVPLIGCGSSTPDDTSSSRPGSTSPSPSTSTPPTKNTPQTERAFAGLERKFDARLGVYAIDTGNGRSITHRPDERFAYASTCKALLAAVMLDKNSLRQLDRLVRYDRDDLDGAGYSPITEKHLDTGLTLRELCDATVRYSDNGAANLLFREIGGPQKLEDALVSIGDRVTRCDRYEDALSEALPGDLRDTSTPRALATDLRAYVVDDALAPAKRAVLTDWLKRNTTGDKVIRAGAPDGWRVGDKTGTGGYGTRNDIAVVWPPKAAPIAIAVLSRRDFKDAEPDDALIAEAARVTLNALA